MHNRGVEEFNLHNIFQLNALAHILPSDLIYLLLLELLHQKTFWGYFKCFILTIFKLINYNLYGILVVTFYKKRSTMKNNRRKFVVKVAQFKLDNLHCWKSSFNGCCRHRQYQNQLNQFVDQWKYQMWELGNSEMSASSSIRFPIVPRLWWSILRCKFESSFGLI
jgi:hypothetical protein